MNTYYSIVYANIRPSILERVSIGLLLWTNENTQFYFSKQKLELFKNFVSDSAYQNVRSTLAGLSENIQKQSNLVDNASLILHKAKSIIDVDYLSRYCNNLLTFSTPILIDIVPNNDNFQKLVQLFVNQNEVEINKEETDQEQFLQSITERLYPAIEARTNLELTVTSDNLSTLILPVKVNFIGKNEVPVAGKAIFFNKRSYNLNNDIAVFINLIRSFEANDVRKGKYFMIGDEPLTKEDNRHKIWEQIRKNNYIDLVPLNEISKITEYMNEHDVKPFVEKEISKN